jgi:hypothetical protein
LQSTPSPGSKKKKKAQASKSTPSPGPKKKNRRKMRSTPSPSLTQEEPPASGAQELSIPLVPNYDVLVGMTSVNKVEFFRDLRRRYKYTRPYLVKAYDLVHDFCKCDIRFVHVVHPKKVVKPKKNKGDSDNDEKKAGVLKSFPKMNERKSPYSDVQQKKTGKPKKDKGHAADKEKKAGVSDPSSQRTKGDSPDSVVKHK